MKKIVRSDPILETVYNYIKDDIVEGYFRQGEKLTVRALCERYSVSDTPVKQALNRLAAEGLVEVIPRKGMRVKTFDAEDVRDLFRARYMIESYCVEEAVRGIQSDVAAGEPFTQLIRTHRAFLESLGQRHTAADYLKHQKMDSQFHSLIVQSANSRHISELYKLSRTHLYMCQIYRKRGDNEMWVTLSEHERICEEMTRCNAEGAKAALRYHFDSLLQDLAKFEQM